MPTHTYRPLVCCLMLAFGAGRPSGGIIAPPTVSLEAGGLEGIRFGSASNEAAFLGVPYAAPPVGELRWKPPRPVSPWSGIRHATAFGASCPQLPAGWLPDLGWSEDCLYLNVWTTQLSSHGRQPVIVWLHGGGNKAGRSQHNPLGPALSRLGVVVVSVNYRLGPFGFLAHPALTAESASHASGNYGLLDQLHALRWVRQNIARFGGDPDQITLMGHSAGAYDACLLMASPMAAGMFQRAIIQSGDCQGTLNPDIRRLVAYHSINGSGEAMGERLARALGVTDGPHILQEMRALPAGQILDVSRKDAQLAFHPVVDGWLLPEEPARAFAKGRQLQIPVLIGSTSDEATVFVGRGGPASVEQYRAYLAAETGRYADQAFQVFPVSSDAEVPARFLQLLNDMFGYGAHAMARAMTRSGQRAYLYYFTYAGAGKRAQLGAFHGEELLFLSDAFPEDWEPRPEDGPFGDAMRRYWTRFAKTGNPNGPTLPVWSAYDAQMDRRFELGRTIGARPVTPQLHALERIMRQIMAAEHADVQPGGER